MRIDEGTSQHGVGFVIRDVYVFVAVHADGDEGVPAVDLGGTMMPLIAADPVRLEELRPLAARIARLSGKPLKLVRFTTREEIETIDPPPRDDVRRGIHLGG